MSMGVERDSLLLVLPVSFRIDPEGRLLFEKQACNGLERWAEHFRSLVVACPLKPDAEVQRDKTSAESTVLSRGIASTLSVCLGLMMSGRS